MSDTRETRSAITEEARQAVTEAGQEALDELIGDGLDPEEAQSLLVDILDAILAWKLFLEDPLATALEEKDGPAITRALEALPSLVEALKPDPNKIEARANRAYARGREKVAERRFRRAARVRLRQGG